MASRSLECRRAMVLIQLCWRKFASTAICVHEVSMAINPRPMYHLCTVGQTITVSYVTSEILQSWLCTAQCFCRTVPNNSEWRYWGQHDTLCKLWRFIATLKDCHHVVCSLLKLSIIILLILKGYSVVWQQCENMHRDMDQQVYAGTNHKNKYFPLSQGTAHNYDFFKDRLLSVTPL